LGPDFYLIGFGVEPIFTALLQYEPLFDFSKID
jgi:hypothetical protein